MMYALLGFEVDRSSKILVKIFNTMEYIKSDKKIIEAPKINDFII